MGSGSRKNSKAKQNGLKYGDIFESRKQILVLPTSFAKGLEKHCQDCGSQTTDSGAINWEHLRHFPWPLGLVASPHRKFLHWGPYCGRAGPCGSYSDCRIHFNKTMRGL